MRYNIYDTQGKFSKTYTMNYFDRGKKEYKTQNYEQAIELFSKALDADPENAYIYYERGLSYFHLTKKGLALVDFDKAVELQPENPFRYSSRAFVRDACGDIDGAIKDYKKAIELDPMDEVAHNNLGLLEEKKGYESYKDRYAKADELAKKHNDFEGVQKEDNFMDNYVKIGDHIDYKDEENAQEVQGEGEKSIGGELKRVFTSKSGFMEFVSFVKNGFKI